MKFFIPFTKNDEEANSVIELISKNTEFPIPSPKIYSIQYKHNGIAMTATVGEETDEYYREDGPVIVILMKPDVYAICTRIRGAVRGDPILVGSSEVQQVTYFE